MSTTSEMVPFEDSQLGVYVCLFWRVPLVWLFQRETTRKTKASLRGGGEGGRGGDPKTRPGVPSIAPCPPLSPPSPSSFPWPRPSLRSRSSRRSGRRAMPSRLAGCVSKGFPQNTGLPFGLPSKPTKNKKQKTLFRSGPETPGNVEG